VSASAGAGLLVCLLAAAAYLNTVGNAFVYDDAHVITGNRYVRGLDQIPKIFGTNYWHDYGRSNLYRPVTIATLALNHAVGGLDPAGYHVVNIALHALASWLVWALARRILPGLAAPLVAGLVFAVHPIHAEAVAPAFGRSEILAAAGVLAALVLHADRYRRGPWAPWGPRALGALAFAAAALSKESAFLLLPLLLLLDAARRERPWRRLGDYAGYVVAAALVFAARSAVLSGGADPVQFGDNPLIAATARERIMTAVVVLGRYLGLLVWPGRLSVDYSYRQIPTVTRPQDPAFLLSAGLLLALLLAGVLCLRRRPHIAFAILFFFAAFASTANVLFPIGTIMAERLAYLPSVSVCLLAGAGISALGPRGTRRGRLGTAALAFLAVGLLGARTVDRNRDWRNDRTLFESAARVSPESFKVHAILGEFHMADRDWESAKAALHRSIELWSEWSDTQWRYGIVLREMGDLGTAQAYFRKAVALDGRFLEARFSLAEIEQRMKHPAAAAQEYARLEAMSRCYPGMHQNLGYALRDMGRLDDAESAFRRGVACFPDSAGLRRGLGQILDALGNGAGAEAAYREALARDTLDAVSANNLAWLLAQRGEALDEALRLANMAVRVRPDAVHFDTLAWILYRRGDRAAAARAIEEAAARDPSNADIRARRRTLLEPAGPKQGGNR
jgi:tetratricopeptide (TPR) repeat protein